MRKPPDHTLYWVYAYWQNGHEFDTTTRLDEARKILRGFLDREPDEAFVFFGNESGAFTNIDPVESVYQ